jgi:hypothetical protein
MKIKLSYIILGALLLPCFTSCYEDKGNYSYTDVEKITITMPENLQVMSHAEYITFSPTIVSSMAGNIEGNNADYEFSCKIQYEHYNYETTKNELWTDIDSLKTKDVNFMANFPAGNYKLWYSVTNKKTKVQTNALGSVKILSSTSEGWMVLNNMGSENKLRLDIISKNSKGEENVAKDILGEKAPVLYNGTQIFMSPSRYNNAEQIYLLSKSGGYRLNVNTLQTTEANNMKLSDFVVPTTPGNPISMLNVVGLGSTIGPTSLFCTTDLGNAYALTNSYSGACFETPLNTNVTGGDATYQISPMIGTSLERPGNSTCVLLYDITNKRFIGWDYNATNNNIAFPLVDPDATGKKFSYTTGMDLISMQSTRYSHGLVYSVLQDAQKKRYVYGINLSGGVFTQESYYPSITAEHFNDATNYAFHSQYPFMFYSYGNKVYAYNLGTGAVTDVLTLDAGETITLLKFNLFMNMLLSKLNDQSAEFLGQQFQLIVGATTSAAEGGSVRFYNISTDGKMTKAKEFTGFGKVVDVTYRERRK